MDNSNLIYIVVDSLRPDFLSCYGYKKNRTPNIDFLAENGCYFTNAITVSPVTTVVFSTLFTGLYPFQHGVREFSYVMPKEPLTLAEIFARNGYKTGAIMGSVVLDKSRQFDRGFEYYNDFFDVQGFYQDREIISDPQHAVIFRFGEVVSQLAKEWISKNKNNKFLLFLHFWDTHLPYFPPKKFLRKEVADYDGIINGSVKQIEEINAGILKVNQEDKEHIQGLYEGGVLNVDNSVGQIIDTLRKLNLFTNTNIILTADHGESLGEHNFFDHGRLLYEDVIRIPLIIFGPLTKGVRGKQIEGLVSNSDIFPTIINNFGFDLGDAMSNIRGKDMNSLIQEEKKEIRKFTYSETYYPKIFENKRIALRSKEWKLIREPYQKKGEGFKERLKNRLDLLNTFIYRYQKNKKERSFLRKKLWDKIIGRKGARVWSRIEENLRAQRENPRELYNIKNDPEEKINLYYSQPEKAKEYERLLENFLAWSGEESFGQRKQDEEMAKKLKELGYL